MKTVVTTIGEGLALHRVVDDTYDKLIQAAVRDLSCDDARQARYPGPNPVSLDTSHFGRLRAEPYVTCEKTDGVRYLLVCCCVPAPRDPLAQPLRVVALVDRAGATYLLPLRHVPTAMFQGSLLDGELAWNKVEKRWDYLVFDASCVSGIPVLNSPLEPRVSAVRRALGPYVIDDADAVRIRVKTFLSGVQGVDAHLGTVSKMYDIDGIILTPANQPVKYGRHMAMFKLKFGGRHTVDFLVAPDGIQLQVFDAGRHVVVAKLSSPAKAGTVVECAVNVAGTWDVVTVRVDKTTANDAFTYQKTLLNMREALTLAEVKRVFDDA